MSIHWEETTVPLKQENKRLRAEIGRLRALACGLAEGRNAVIEECARVADGFFVEEAEFGYNPTAVKIAAAIRALKDKP